MTIAVTMVSIVMEVSVAMVMLIDEIILLNCCCIIFSMDFMETSFGFSLLALHFACKNLMKWLFYKDHCFF